MFKIISERKRRLTKSLRNPAPSPPEASINKQFQSPRIPTSYAPCYDAFVTRDEIVAGRRCSPSDGTGGNYADAARCVFDWITGTTLVSIISSLGNYQNRPIPGPAVISISRDVEPITTSGDRPRRPGGMHSGCIFRLDFRYRGRQNHPD